MTLQRRTRRAAAAAALALAALGAAAPAAAQTSGFYAGGFLGGADWKSACRGFTGAGTSCDDADTAWRAIAGYQLARSVALEAGYVDFGRAAFSEPGASGDTKASAWEASVLGALKVLDRWALLGRLGAYRADVKQRTLFAGSFEGKNGGFTIGFGARYELTPAVALRGEWQRYKNVGGGAVAQTDIDVVGVSAIWRF